MFLFGHHFLSSRDLNPLTPRSDLHATSPYNLFTLSSKQVMRILKLIMSKLSSWSNTKFSSLIYEEKSNS